MKIKELIYAAIVAKCLLLLVQPVHAAEVHLKADDTQRWYKGQTHTHTLWSDGDAPPDYVTHLYKERGYNFISITEHNVLPVAQRWMPVGRGKRISEKQLELFRDTLGEENVEVREVDGKLQMRLKTLPDLKEHFDVPGEFEVMWGEEITSFTPEVHVNGINVREVIRQATSEEKSWAIRTNINAVAEQSKRLGIPMFAHLDHPNWSGGITPKDMLDAGNVSFFEVYNGHGGVRNWGRAEMNMVSTEKMWDIMLAQRLSRGGGVVYGVGTDDGHNYFNFAVGKANPFRGWCMVLAPELSAAAIVTSYQQGRYYISTGVTLDEIKADDEGLRISIQADEGVTYTTQFIGTMKSTSTASRAPKDALGNDIPRVTRVYESGVGQILFETTDNPAVYPFTGDELYVRAKVSSDVLQDNPFAEGDLESAWIQPVVVAE